MLQVEISPLYKAPAMGFWLASRRPLFRRSGRKEFVGPRNPVAAAVLRRCYERQETRCCGHRCAGYRRGEWRYHHLIAARSQQEKPSEPQVLSQEVPREKASADVADTATLSAGPDAEVVDLKTGSAIRTSSKPTPKPTPVITPQPGKSLPQESVSRDTSRVRSTDASQRESTQGTVYTWYDRDRIMQAVLQNDLAVQKTSANTESDEAVVAKGQDSIVRKQSG